jgi:hypothetical protein
MAKKSKESVALGALDSKMLSKLLAETGNPYAAIVEDIEDTFDYYDTGSYSLNLLMSGSTRKGHPNNFVTVLGGESSTGKSFFVIGMIKEFIKKYPDALVFVFESENAPTWTKTSLGKLGIPGKNVSILSVSTIQETTTQALKLATAYMNIAEDVRPRAMFILDSLGQLSTIKEMEDSEAGKDKKDMTKAGETKRFFRTTCQKLGRAKIPMFVTNHVYDVIGAYVPTKTQGGGKGPIYTASTVLTLTKSKDKDDEGSGVIITAKTEKGRLTKEKMKVKTKISYTKGLDRYYGLLEICIDYDLVEKEGNSYVFPTGAKGFRKTILAEPEKFWTDEMLDKIDSEIGEQFFMYGGEGKPIEDTEDE